MTRIFYWLYMWIRWIPWQALTFVLCLHYRQETVHCSTKDVYTSEITFLALHPWRQVILVQYDFIWFDLVTEPKGYHELKYCPQVSSQNYLTYQFQIWKCFQYMVKIGPFKLRGTLNLTNIAKIDELQNIMIFLKTTMI